MTPSSIVCRSGCGWSRGRWPCSTCGAGPGTRARTDCCSSRRSPSSTWSWPTWAVTWLGPRARARAADGRLLSGEALVGRSRAQASVAARAATGGRGARGARPCHTGRGTGAPPVAGVGGRRRAATRSRRAWCRRRARGRGRRSCRPWMSAYARGEIHRTAGAICSVEASTSGRGNSPPPSPRPSTTRGTARRGTSTPSRGRCWG